MFTKPPIPMDERFIRWLIAQVRRIQSGSMILEIEQGKLKSISCPGHRYFYTPEELTETADPAC